MGKESSFSVAAFLFITFTGNGLRQRQVVAEVVAGALVRREERHGEGAILVREDVSPPEGNREKLIQVKHRPAASFTAVELGLNAHFQGH